MEYKKDVEIVKIAKIHPKLWMKVAKECGVDILRVTKAQTRVATIPSGIYSQTYFNSEHGKWESIAIGT